MSTTQQFVNALLLRQLLNIPWGRASALYKLRIAKILLVLNQPLALLEYHIKLVQPTLIKHIESKLNKAFWDFFTLVSIFIVPLDALNIDGVQF